MNGENHRGKTPSGEFKVTTHENPLLWNKRLQVKWNLQLNPYPNTLLDLWCSDNLSFQCTAPRTWLTNQCTDPSKWLTHQLEKDVGCKVFQFIQQWRSRSSLVTKPLAQRCSSFYKEDDELGQIVSGHNMHE